MAVDADIAAGAHRLRFQTRGEHPPVVLGREDSLVVGGVAGLLCGMRCNRVLLGRPEAPGTLHGRHAARAATIAPRSAQGDCLSDEQLLDRAAELVARGWARERRARDGLGQPVAPWSDRARRWSPVGALQRVWHESGGGPLEVFETAYLAVCLATGGRLDVWNASPSRTKRNVLTAFMRARRYLPDAREQLGISH